MTQPTNDTENRPQEARRPNGSEGADQRPRPPGPEDRRGATATSPTAGGEPSGSPSVWNRIRRPNFWVIFAVLLFLNWFIVPLIFPPPSDLLTISYSVFRQEVTAGNVAEVTSQGDEVQGVFKTPVAEPTPPEGQAPRSYTKFDTHIPTFADNQSLDQLLQEKGVTISAKPLEEPRPLLATLLLSFGPTLLLIGGFLWLSSRMAGAASGGMFSMGRSRARRYETGEGRKAVTFADVAGIDEVKADLVEVVDFLREPDRYGRLGGTMPKGVLLLGQPGTGKTLLARAVAGEAGVPFFSISGSEFIEMIVGVGASRVRDLFTQAKAAAPSIIFVDELDAIGRRRGSGHAMGGHDEREQTLNQLLVEMDGFDGRQGVIVLAATNRADVLDPALLRPGRFDRRVVVHPPDRAGRAAILKVHTRGVPLGPDVNLDAIAGETPGLVGADLRNLVNEAALLAARKDRDAVFTDDFAEALEKIALGAERRIALSAEERERVAYHEAGHALVGLLQPEGDPVRRVTVVPRGQALGVTLSVPEADRYNHSEGYLQARIAAALGGRAAEQVIYGTVTTGAENDLQQVTNLARAMVTRWGMSAEVGLLALEGTDAGNFLDAGAGVLTPTRALGQRIADAADSATGRIVDECYARAVDLLTRERQRLVKLAEELLRSESLDEQQIRAVTGLTADSHLESPVAAAR